MGCEVWVGKEGGEKSEVDWGGDVNWRWGGSCGCGRGVGGGGGEGEGRCGGGGGGGDALCNKAGEKIDPREVCSL